MDPPTGTPATPHGPPAAHPAALAARLQALQEAGAPPDPVQARYLASLPHRLATTPDPVRRVLESRLDAGLTALESRGHAAPPGQTPARAASRPEAASPLADLTRHLRLARHQAPDRPPDPARGPDAAAGKAPPPELASVRRFGQAWQRIAAEDRVRRAVGRAPANAGPLNSHRLVLRSLELLRSLSPHYLNRFVLQVETLQWLEQTSRQLTPVKPKPARRSRTKKA